MEDIVAQLQEITNRSGLAPTYEITSLEPYKKPIRRVPKNQESQALLAVYVPHGSDQNQSFSVAEQIMSLFHKGLQLINVQGSKGIFYCEQTGANLYLNNDGVLATVPIPSTITPQLQHLTCQIK